MTARRPPKTKRILKAQAAEVMTVERTESGIEVYMIPGEFGRVPILVSVPWDSPHGRPGGTQTILANGDGISSTISTRSHARDFATQLAHAAIQKRADRGSPDINPFTDRLYIDEEASPKEGT